MKRCVAVLRRVGGSMPAATRALRDVRPPFFLARPAPDMVRRPEGCTMINGGASLVAPHTTSAR
jgi:hypothetical protein